VVKENVCKTATIPCPPVDLSGEAGWIQFDAPSLVGNRSVSSP